MTLKWDRDPLAAGDSPLAGSRDAAGQPSQTDLRVTPDGQLGPRVSEPVPSIDAVDRAAGLYVR